MPTLSRLPIAHDRRLGAGLAALAGAGALLVGPASGVVTGPARAALTSPVTVAASARVGALSSTPIVGMAPSGDAGYWLVSSSGTVVSVGSAASHGSSPTLGPGTTIAGIVATPDDGGYWLFSGNGGVLTFGDAPFKGSAGRMKLGSPVVAMAATPSGDGYWLVTARGGVLTFGDAGFHGSAVGMSLGAPVVGIAATPNGGGYWLTTANGGVLTFGNAAFEGSAGKLHLASPVVGMATTGNGGGYWLTTANGGVLTYGNAAFQGAAGAFDRSLGAVTVGIRAVGNGYWVATNVGRIDSLGAPAAPTTSETVYSPAPSASASALPAETMPSANISPSAAFGAACWTVPVNDAACDSAALAAIDSARASEGYGPLQLPSDYSSLPITSQVIAVANAERTSRGLPALPENTALDLLAQAGATADGGAGTDPTGPSGYGWGSNIAWGDPTALSADFSWMYDDGPGGENVDCRAAGDAGCWGHRENILADWGGASGAGAHDDNGTLNLTELFVENF